MTTQYRQAPTYTDQIASGQRNSATWYRYFQQAELGTPPAAEVPITGTALGASPFSYIAPQKGFVIVSGGTVTSIMFSRTPGPPPVFYNTGETAGEFPLAQNDVLKITYTVKPTVTFVPT